MDNFAYSMVQNWIDKDFLFQATTKLVDKVAKASARIVAAVALTAGSLNVAIASEPVIVVPGYQISTTENSNKDSIVESAVFNSFSKMDELIAKLNNGITGFVDPKLAALADDAAKSNESTIAQDAQQWATALLQSVKFRS